MMSVICHEPTGRRIDLFGGVDAPTFEWLESLGPCPRIDPLVTCGTCNGALYLRHNPSDRSRLHGVHHSQNGCRDLVISRQPGMSDEHKREAEYHALAGQLAGFAADLEVVTTGRTRVDVVVGGAGFEVQRSGVKIGEARDRTRRSMAAGLTSVSWFSDARSRPVWWAKVPSYASMASWDHMPPLRSVEVRGPQRAVAVRCAIGSFPKCPEGKRRPCGEFHVKWQPWAMLLDDLVTRAASGLVVPARTGLYIRLVTPESLQLVEELTGTSAAYEFSKPLAIAPAPARRIECERPIVLRGPQLELVFPGARLCTVCRQQPAGPGGILCAADKAALTLSVYGGRE